jgi:hypothetical protein
MREALSTKCPSPLDKLMGSAWSAGAVEGIIRAKREGGKGGAMRVVRVRSCNIACRERHHGMSGYAGRVVRRESSTGPPTVKW